MIIKGNRKSQWLFFSLLIISIGVKAQEYKQSVGIRGGVSSGIDYRIFSDEYNSFRFFLSTRNDGLQFVALKEFYEPEVFDVCKELSFVYGFGLHMGYEKWDKHMLNNNVYYWENHTAPILGIDGLVGLEYNFWQVPLTMGVEIKPFAEIFGRKTLRIRPFDIGFTLRYNF